MKPSRCEAGGPLSDAIGCHVVASGEWPGNTGVPDGFEKTISIGALNSVT